MRPGGLIGRLAPAAVGRNIVAAALWVATARRGVFLTPARRFALLLLLLVLAAPLAIAVIAMLGARGDRRRQGQERDRGKANPRFQDPASFPPIFAGHPAALRVNRG